MHHPDSNDTPKHATVLPVGMDHVAQRSSYGMQRQSPPHYLAYELCERLSCVFVNLVLKPALAFNQIRQCSARGMRRRLLRWQTDTNDKNTVESSADSPLSTQRKSKGIDRLQYAFTLARIFVSCAVALVIYKIALSKFRYTKEKDPFYKALRFGNVSAVADLYEALHLNELPLSPRLPVVFYNVYLPSGGDGALTIVNEQLHQISSIAKEYKGGQQAMTVNVVTIGDNLNATAAVEVCHTLTSLQCRHTHHYESADEVVTLQALYDHCQVHPSATVTYLHSKGSFHRSDTNDAWRRALTAAALHPDCWSHDICSVCGLQFFTQFTLFWPGNMWTSSCGYVNKLIPPRLFQRHLENAMAEMLRLRLEGTFTSYLLRDRRDYFGLDRYHAEHWIGSHPDLQPCDMEPLERPQDVFKRMSSIQDVGEPLSFSLAPRHAGFAVGHNFEAHLMLQKNEQERKKEIYLLPGKLFLWNTLYQLAPSVNSWVWKWFPDGMYWKSRISDFRSNEFESELVVRDTLVPARANVSFTSEANGLIFFQNSLESPDATKHQLKQLRDRTNAEWVVFLRHTVDFEDRPTSLLLKFCHTLWGECRLLASPHASTSLLDAAGAMAMICDRQSNNKRTTVLEGRCQGPDLSLCPPEFRHRISNEVGIECVGGRCHRLSVQSFFMDCSLVLGLQPLPLFLKMTEAALQGLQLADIRNETRWKPSPKEDSTMSEFLFDAWMSIHPATQYCYVINTITQRNRTLLLAVLLVAEVYYNQHAFQELSCIQQWKELLHLPSSYVVSTQISERDLQRIHQVMEEQNT